MPIFPYNHWAAGIKQKRNNRLSGCPVSGELKADCFGGTMLVMTSKQPTVISADEQPTVLIADEESIIRSTLAVIFQQAGINAVTAATMREAAELIIKHDPDCVLTDDRLADGGGGCELCRQFRNNGYWQRLPFLMAATHEVPAEKLREAGINQFIAEPIDPRLLIEKIKTVIADYIPFKETMPRPNLKLRKRARRQRNRTPWVVAVTRFSRVQL